MSAFDDLASQMTLSSIAAELDAAADREQGASMSTRLLLATAAQVLRRVEESGYVYRREGPDAT